MELSGIFFLVLIFDDKMGFRYPMHAGFAT